MDFRLKSLCLVALLTISNAFALDYLYKTSHFPSEFDLMTLKSKKKNIILDVDSYYPTESEITVLKQLKLKHLTVHAGHFPTKNQIQLLDSLNTSYDIIVSEVFPSTKEIAEINSSKINSLVVRSWDFPTTGEVEIFNKINIPFTFEILRSDLPLPEHMVVIKQFKPEATIAFNHSMVPGPGYANFFNSLKSFKHFKVNEMPYGKDYIGANSLKRSSFEVSTIKRPMKYESKVINKFNVAPTMNFERAYPFDQEVLIVIQQFKTNKTIINDDGNGELLKSIIESMFIDTNNIVFTFNEFH